MKVKTSRFGQIEVAEDDRLTVVGGFLGFYGLTGYVEHRPAGLGIFRWLQSLDVSKLAFVVCDARVILPDYHIEISPEELGCIGLEDAGDAEIVVILRYPQDPGRMTANLLGPVVINRRTRKARQVVLSNTDYSCRHIVFPHLWREKDGDVAKPREQECA